MYFQHALPRLKKGKKAKPTKMGRPKLFKMTAKSMFGKKKGKKKPIY